MDYANLNGDSDADTAWRVKGFIELASERDFYLFLEHLEKGPREADAARSLTSAYLSFEFETHRVSPREAGRLLRLLSSAPGMKALESAVGPDRRANEAWAGALELAAGQEGGPASEEALSFLLACVREREGLKPELLAEACVALMGSSRMGGEAGKRAIASGLARLEPVAQTIGAGAFWQLGLACARAPSLLKEMKELGAPLTSGAILAGLMSLARPAVKGAGPMGERSRVGGLNRYLGQLIDAGALNEATVQQALKMGEVNLPLDARALLEARWIEAGLEAAKAKDERPPAPRL